MARSTTEIKLSITNEFITNPEIINKYGLIEGQSFEQQFSIVSLENILFNIIAFCLSVHEKIVSSNAANSRPQNLPNFIQTILNFHDGLPLVWKDGQFQYDLTDVATPEALQVVDRCAVLESEDGELVVKVATDNAGVLEPIAVDILERLAFYLGQMKVPGVRIRLINEVADSLLTTINVYVDPLQIDLTTGRQLNTEGEIYPAKVAINEYLNALEFNGAFVTNFFSRAIEDKEGIYLVDVELMQWKYADFDFESFSVSKVPQSGYFKIADIDLTINYLPYALVNN